jgi:hypothetical protein
MDDDKQLSLEDRGRLPFEKRSPEEKESAVLAIIRLNPSKFSAIHHLIDGSRPESRRDIDYTLQRLKRKRLATYNTKSGWSVAQ